MNEQRAKTRWAKKEISWNEKNGKHLEITRAQCHFILLLCRVCVYVYVNVHEIQTFVVVEMASTARAGAAAALAKDEDSVYFSRVNDFVMVAIIGIWLNIANTFDADFANALSLPLTLSAFLCSEYLFVFYLIFFSAFFRRLLVFYACLCFFVVCWHVSLWFNI